MIKVKRIYEKPAKSDGFRVLVDRLWPRGMKKTEAHVDLWLKDIAPSRALRTWFGHDPKKWDEFRKRYASELDDKYEAVQAIRRLSRKGTVTLLYGAKDEEHNNAGALKEYLEGKLAAV